MLFVLWAVFQGSNGDACPAGSEAGECSASKPIEDGGAEDSAEEIESLDDVPILTEQVQIAGPATAADFAKLMDWARENGAEISPKVRMWVLSTGPGDRRRNSMDWWETVVES